MASAAATCVTVVQPEVNCSQKKASKPFAWHALLSHWHPMCVSRCSQWSYAGKQAAALCMCVQHAGGRTHSSLVAGVLLMALACLLGCLVGWLVCFMYVLQLCVNALHVQQAKHCKPQGRHTSQQRRTAPKLDCRLSGHQWQMMLRCRWSQRCCCCRRFC